MLALGKINGNELGATIGDGDISNGHVGIAHAPFNAYDKLHGSLNPDTSVTVPLESPVATHLCGPVATKARNVAKVKYFLQLMKTLLRSHVIVKSPLKNASDIRALCGAKAEIEAKGYAGTELTGLLIATHRLWTPERMGAFVSKTTPSAASD